MKNNNKTATSVSDCDAYKLSHKGFMTPKTEIIYSNMTARSSKYLPVIKDLYDEKIVVFGTQYFILDYLIREWNEKFFSRPKKEVISIFKRRCDTYLGPDAISMDHFEELHDLGFLPVEIKSWDEGTRIPIKIPILTIKNTDTRFSWITNYLETIISCELWKPITNATIAFEFYKLLRMFYLETTGKLTGIEWAAHGFEFRGMSGRHDAAINGAATLLSSCGTDTIPAIDLLEEFYNANAEKELIAASVPASEHMLTSLGTSVSSELDFFRKAITEDYPTGIVSLVSDTYDFFVVVTDFARALKDDILNRKPNALGLAKVVFRPDSGNPVKIICGYSDEEKKSLIKREDGIYTPDGKTKLSEAEIKGAIECLWEIFGGTINQKGFKLLHDRVGLIYGDSITQEIAYQILTHLKDKGFAANNIVFGVGSFSRNLLSRDSLSIAIKGTWAQVDGKGYELYKQPKTDDGTKKSAKGLLRVDLVDGEYILKDQCTPEEEAGGELKTVFKDGKLLIETSLSEIRARLQSTL